MDTNAGGSIGYHESYPLAWKVRVHWTPMGCGPNTTMQYIGLCMYVCECLCVCIYMYIYIHYTYIYIYIENIYIYIIYIYIIYIIIMYPYTRLLKSIS